MYTSQITPPFFFFLQNSLFHKKFVLFVLLLLNDVLVKVPLKNVCQRLWVTLNYNLCRNVWNLNSLLT